MFEITELNKLLKAHQISPTKRFGQNFLINANIVGKIARSLGNTTNRNILEIGPGLGVLTISLLQKDINSLTVVEVDRKFIPILEEIKANTSKAFHLVNADALKVVEEEIISGNYTIVSNLPYNIGSLLLVKWLKKMDFVDEIIIMLQKEVADRVLAEVATAEYGRLSVLAQYICHCEKLFDVEPENFFPAPKVYSSVIKLVPKTPKIELARIENIEKACKAAFNLRRKKIKTSLKPILSNPEEELMKIGIDFNKRAEELTVDEFDKISYIM
ncbi:16S rRNA (adenine(1518)-N(6)/adenine(1519)-N(6))-dimethyltransferase RsmA [Candidatus Bandiella euplotis]|uniref:Ribosomal RNA small subunit methyltransferase A n=1 Tax=Candidatus Bandiella euplotis TaxID=1664265 RepID=A0ABZ0UPC3_9RICK|nr:16S rRNA (adenine(1518)-N(6)/adenine(1519)-N(6))-dimethyltransferase RsmA [Candidatus Bandiella woodruffii]WPX96553.1 Ribosomal RNA small subunit methyltransferase A [Candidatus Bandiella woodruffii]